MRCLTLLLLCSFVSNSLRPHGLQPARLLCPWNFLRQRILEWVALSFAGDLPDPGIGTKSLASPALAGRFFYHCATWEALLGIATR